MTCSQCTVAAQNPGNLSLNFSALHSLFLRPPFTEPPVTEKRPVGNLFREAAAQYESSLEYSRELSADDRKLCFPRRDDECIRLQTDSDRMYRGLLVNEALGALQSVEAELSYLSECERTGRSRQGLKCAADALTDLAELDACLAAAGLAMDRYFDLVPAANLRSAMEILARTNERWQVVPLESEPAIAPR